MTTVQLFMHDKPFLIVPAPTGVVYTNQANGIMCDHPEVEGFLIPLDMSSLEICVGCSQFTDEHVITEAEILELESVIPDWIKVDRAKAKESCESWVWVNVLNSPEYSETDYTGPAILTWKNCD